MDNIMNVSEVQLSYKSNVKSSTRYKINSSQDAYELLIKCFPDDTIEYKESFKESRSLTLKVAPPGTVEANAI